MVQAFPDVDSDELMIKKLTKALKDAALTLSPRQGRYLVDAYYQLQENRKATANQLRAAKKEGEPPNPAIEWIYDNMVTLENQAKHVLGTFARSQRAGRWMLSVHGVGPVLSAGFLAHLDIEKAPTAGSFWRFAGLDPTVTWEKGQKRPWNGPLKTLCWRFANTQQKFQNMDGNCYGKWMAQYKAMLEERNEAGEFAEAAARQLERHPQHAQRAIYEQGKLPPGHLEARAFRWGAKLFLSHLHHVLCECAGREPPKPWVIVYGGHTHMIEPPGWPCD